MVRGAGIGNPETSRPEERPDRRKNYSAPYSSPNNFLWLTLDAGSRYTFNYESPSKDKDYKSWYDGKDYRGR